MKYLLNHALVAVVAILSSAAAVAAAGPSPAFSYGQDERGPQHWGDIDPLYAKCGTGKEQSPIDVGIDLPSVTLTDKPISGLNYSPLRDVLCGFDGHNVKCEWNSTVAAPDKRKRGARSKAGANINTIKVDDKEYTLTNFHFHTPGEHRVNGHFFEAELHLVHQAADGALAVIGVLLEVQAKNNPFFNWIVSLAKKAHLAAPGHGFLTKDPHTGASVAGKEQIKYKLNAVDFAPLLRATGQFSPRWDYEGSLTAPPCTEGVSWMVVKTPVYIGLEQFDALVALEAFNSRFLQDRLA
ncbi:hypothetical protein BGZ99_000301 [Dissophora globulifera]|uniref:carbonic anhydrase n=1 Tax=Dissophora globulifera TaxID=979702 RepID=A0A9P6R2H9_9FUNG|nr:hypothetical protein BGZ99_000301 [Dissophora globulifera]